MQLAPTKVIKERLQKKWEEEAPIREEIDRVLERKKQEKRRCEELCGDNSEHENSLETILGELGDGSNVVIVVHER